MLVGGAGFFIDVNGKRRDDLYEHDEHRKLLARRVELPEWLSVQAFAIPPSEPLLPFFIERRWKNPKGAIAESQGHIYLNPQSSSCPLVGVDVEIWCRFNKPVTSVSELVFVIFGTDYVELDRWAISWPEFVHESVEIDPGPPFMPQRMVPLSKLQHYRPK